MKLLVMCRLTPDEADGPDVALVDLGPAERKLFAMWKAEFDRTKKDAPHLNLWTMSYWSALPDWYAKEGTTECSDFDPEDFLSTDALKEFERDEYVVLSDAMFRSVLALEPEELSMDVCRAVVCEDGVYWRAAAKHGDVYAETRRVPWSVLVPGKSKEGGMKNFIIYLKDVCTDVTHAYVALNVKGVREAKARVKALVAATIDEGDSKFSDYYKFDGHSEVKTETFFVLAGVEGGDR